MEKRDENLEAGRDRETVRILEELKKINLKEQEIYLRAYADALEYAHRFLREKKGKLEEYLP